MAVEIVQDNATTRITFSGVVSGDDLGGVIRAVIQVEAERQVSPGRLVDFGPSTTVAVSFANIAALASVRREMAPRNAVRTAIVVHNATQRGYARMFQTLNDHPLVTVEIFESLDEARRWLEASDRSESEG